MLVHGVAPADGLKVQEAGGMFPYPIGHERVDVCRQVASVVRAIKREFVMRLGMQQP